VHYYLQLPGGVVLGNTTAKVAKRYERIRANVGKAFVRGDLGDRREDGFGDRCH